MAEEMKLAKHIDEIYKDIEPSLIGCAYRYKVPNPNEVVKEWLSRAFIIADRFDKGELKKKVHIDADDGSMKTEDYNPTLHSEEDFIKSLKYYLKKAFVHDVIKQYNKRKRYHKYQSSQMHTIPQYGSGSESIDNLLDAIHIKDIIDILKIDVLRLSGSKTSVLDLVNQKFLEAISDYCIQLEEEFGNFVVVQDVDQKDNKRFFSEDFRDDLEDGVRKNLCRIILEEANPMLIHKLGFLISKDKRGTLQKRLFRYFFEYHNGYPKRLRNRIKNGMIK